MLGVWAVLASCRDDEGFTDELELVSGPIRVLVPENPWRIQREADSYSFYVECEGSGWVASTESEWVTLTPSSGQESQYLRFDVEENPEPFARAAVITVADAKDPHTFRVQVRIRQSGYNDEDNETLTGDMLQRHRMGFGYDIMKEYASDNSFSKYPVLDYEKVVALENSRNLVIISEDRRHYQDLEIFSGRTVTELSGKLTKSMDSGSSFFGSREQSTTSILRTKSIDQVCGVVRLKQIVSSRTIDVGAFRSQATSDESPLFSGKFREALRKIQTKEDAAQLILQFGTHLVVSADLGGCLHLEVLISRDTSIEEQHSVVTITRKFFGITVGQSNHQYDSYQGEIGLDFDGKMTISGGHPDTHHSILAAVRDKRQISPAEIKTWQASFNMDPTQVKDYNVSMVGCRLIPLYELVNDARTRACLQAAYADYTHSPALMPTPEDQPLRVELAPQLKDWEKEHHSRVFKVEQSGTVRTVLAREYVPSIRTDAPVVVAYPVIKGKPYFFSGLFVGDEDHRPGAVRWLGNSSLYEPNDSICAERSEFAHLFTERGSLKQIYLYDAGVQILPPWNGQKYVPDSEIDYHFTRSVLVLNTENFLQASSIPLVKVGPWFWTESSSSRIPMTTVFYDSYLKWQNDADYTLTYYPLSNLIHLPKWDQHNARFVTYAQAESLLKVCQGNLDALFNTDGNGRNLLGLKWMKGYLSKMAFHSPVWSDTNSYLLVTYNGTTREISRLTPSGRTSHLSNKAYFDGVYNVWNSYCYMPIYLSTNRID